MPTRKLSHGDAKKVYHLLNECRELGDDAGQWKSHLMSGVARLVGADIVLHATLSGVHENKFRMLNGGAWGFEHGFNLAGWTQLIQEHGIEMRSEMAEQMFLKLRDPFLSGLTLTRQALFPDTEWERTFDCQVIARTIGTDPVMQSCHRIAGRPDMADAMTIGRHREERLFDELEESIVRLVHSECVLLIGEALASHEDPQPARLPFRVRQVLRCLLEGDGDKRIAQRLGLSIHTVNQYIKTIYRFFQVSARAELLSRWVRRGWKLNEHDWITSEDYVRYDLV